MSIFTIETERLVLRPHDFEDAAFMVELNSDPEVNLYTGDGPVDESQTTANIKKLKLQFEERKIGRFIAIEKISGAKVGWSGLKYLEDRQVIDLGYRFLKAKWGMGYATESARAFLHYGFDTLGFREITARADPRNLASLNVLKKLGMIQSELGRDDEGEFFDFIIQRKDFISGKSHSPAGRSPR